MSELRALSLTPPWPWAVCDLGKTVENRTRLPAPKFRGRLAIHASGRKSSGQVVQALYAIERAAGDLWFRLPNHRLRHATGVIVCVVDVVAEVSPANGGVAWYDADRDGGRGWVDLTPAERRWWFGGPAYIFANVRKLREPVPCKGALGLWRVPADVAARVEEQL